jgi:hypothetical protein
MRYLHGRRAHYLWLAIILAATAVVYWPGLQGPFVFDDFQNIVNNPAVAMTRLSWSALATAVHGDHSGYLPRWLPMVSFAVDHYIAGNFDNTLPFKLTNLLIHLVNTILVYAIARRLVRRLPTGENAWLAPMVAAIWALHPIQLTVVLYVVQRMASMSALFVLGGLLLYLAGRERLQQEPRRAVALMLGGLVGGVLLGISCKENAILLPLLALATELTLYRTDEPGTRQQRTMRLLFATVIGIPLIIGLIWLAFHPDFIGGSYVNRDFNLTQRVLTETRVLWYYLGLLAVPIPSHFAIYHDDFALSTGLIHPASTLLAIIGWLAAGALAWRWRTRAPELGFALLWYLSAQALESSVIGLELVHEHRNYVASFGPLLMGVSMLARLPVRAQSAGWRRALVLAFILSAGISTLTRAAIWRSDDSLIPSLVHNHPQSARNQAIMGEYLLHRRHDPLGAMARFRRAAQLRPRHADALLETVRIAMQTRIKLSGANRRPQLPPALRDIIQAIPRADDPTRYRLRAKPVLLTEIESRLKNTRVGPDTSYQLAQLADCAGLAPRTCDPLTPNIRQWYRLAIDNPETHGLARAWLALGLAKLELDTGRPAKALDALKFSARLRSKTPRYWLLLAQAALRSGDPGQARAAVRRLHDPAWQLDPEQLAVRARLDRALAKPAARQR